MAVCMEALKLSADASRVPLPGCPASEPPPQALPDLGPWPSLHHPAERALVLHLRGWQLRGHPEAPDGLGHLQLWHNRGRVSVLTPGHLTRGRLEVYPIDGRRLRVASYWQLRDLLERHHAITPPSAPALAAALRWCLRADSAEDVPAHARVEGLSGTSIVPLEGSEAVSQPQGLRPPVEVVSGGSN